jgi:hypothetical protein
MTNETETATQELDLEQLDEVQGGAAAPDVSGAGKPVWAGVIAPGHGIISI